MTEYPKISPLGDRGILIEFGGDIESETLQKVLFYKQKIEKEKFKEDIQVTNTYNSLLISYMFTIEDVYGEFLELKELISETNIPKKRDYKIFHIPVCYDEEFGFDLEQISRVNNLSQPEIIQLHTSPLYQLYFIGFLPGFLYLGGLRKELYIPRRNTPRKSVEKGSVGIGGNQTGIYPKTSPGGWQILGRSPVNLFDKNSLPPSPFSAGDKIKFFEISKDDFYEIEGQVKDGLYKLKTEKHES